MKVETTSSRPGHGFWQNTALVLFLRNLTNQSYFKKLYKSVFLCNVKSWSRKEEYAENEPVSPQVTLPLKWV